MPIDTKEPTFVRVHKDVLLENYDHFSRGGVAIAPVIKSNAYGHDACQVARLFAEETDAPFLITATYQQAAMLRDSGISTPLLIIGYVPSEVIASNPHKDITFTAVDSQHLQEIDDALDAPQSVHLKLDTGMHRYGVKTGELNVAISTLKNAENIRLTGVFSHFSDTFKDEVNDFTRDQIRFFNTAAGKLTKQFPSCTVTHLASTSSHKLRRDIDATVERVGIGLFGLANFTDEFHTEPTLSLMSTIATIRTIKAGDSVGYSRTYTADQDRQVATIPAGYYEGVDRRLSNCGVVRIGEDVCPIIGKVSMNATTIDITDCSKQVQRGDLVEIISADRNAPNSARAITETIDAVHYRITTQIPARLPRIMV